MTKTSYREELFNPIVIEFVEKDAIPVRSRVESSGLTELKEQFEST